MARAILCGVFGAAVLLLGALGLYSMQQAPTTRIPLIYASMMVGAILLTYGILYARLVIRYGHPRRGSAGSVPVDTSISTGIALHTDSGQGFDCGHSDAGGSGGDCGGNGGSH